MRKEFGHITQSNIGRGDGGLVYQRVLSKIVTVCTFRVFLLLAGDLTSCSVKDIENWKRVKPSLFKENFGLFTPNTLFLFRTSFIH